LGYGTEKSSPRLTHATYRQPASSPVRQPSRETTMTKKTWQAPKVETTSVSMEVTMYLPAQA
jgi:coenzyme PQQ precursor peptide PqqA